MSIALLLSAEASQAVAVGATGQIAFRILNLPPALIPATSIPVVLNGSGGFGHLTKLDIPAGKFEVDGGLLPLTDPGSAPIRGVQLTLANQIGEFEGVGGAGFTGIMGLQGVARVCLFAGCPVAVANLTVPLSVVGAGGYQYAT